MMVKEQNTLLHHNPDYSVISGAALVNHFIGSSHLTAIELNLARELICNSSQIEFLYCTVQCTQLGNY